MAEITENTLKAFDEASSNPKNDTTGFQWQGLAGDVTSALYFDNQEKLFKSRNEASTAYKTTIMGQMYDDNSFVGALQHKLGFGDGKVRYIDDDNYQEQMDFTKNILTPSMVYDILTPLGGQEQDIKNVYERAKSEKHLTALIAETTDKIKRREVQNEILTEGQQAFALGYSALFDADTFASVYIPVGVASKVAKTGQSISRIGTYSLSASSGLFAGSKPFVLDSYYNQGRPTSELMVEGIMLGSVEFLATKFLTPEFKAKAKEAVTDSSRALALLAHNPQVDNISTKPILEILTGGARTIDDRLADFGVVPLPPTQTGKYPLAAAGSEVVDTPLTDAYRYVKGVEQGLIKPISEESRIILDEYKASRQITAQPETIETTAKQTSIAEPKGVTGKLLDEVNNLNARTMAKEAKGTTSNQMTKYFREVKQGLQDYLSSAKTTLTKDTEFMQHLTNKDYEMALLRAEELVNPSTVRKELKALEDAKVKKQIDNDVVPLPEGINAKFVNAVREEIQSIVATQINRGLKSGEEPMSTINFNSVVTAHYNAMTKINKMFDDIRGYIGSISRATDEKFKMINGLKAEINEFLTGITKLDGVSPEDIAKIRNSVNKALGDLETDVIIAERKSATEASENAIVLKREGGNYTFGKYKIPVAVALALFAGTQAQASSFGDGNKEIGTGSLIVDGIVGLMVLGAVVVGGKQLISKNSFLRQSISKSISQAGKDAGVLQKAGALKKSVIESLRGGSEWARTGFTETYAPLLKYAKETGNEKLQKFIEATLYNAMEGKSMVAEMTKDTWIKVFQKDYIDTETKLFNEWAKANGVGVGTKIYDAFFSGGLRTKFREYVSMAKDGAGEIPETGRVFVEQMAQESTKMMEKHALNRAKELGIEGIDEMREVLGYVTRKYHDNVGSIIGSMSKESYESFRNLFKEMHLSAINKSYIAVQNLTKDATKTLSGFQTINDLKAFMKQNQKAFEAVAKNSDVSQQLLKDIDVVDDLAEAKDLYIKLSDDINGLVDDVKMTAKVERYLKDVSNNEYQDAVADVFGSFKKRLPLDLSKFKSQDYLINNEQKTLGLHDIFDRDDYDLAHRYVANMSGRSALKQSGFEVSEVKDMIKRIKDIDKKQVASDVLDMLIGNPVQSMIMTSRTRAFYQFMANTTSAMSLITVGFAYSAETALLLGKLITNPKEGRIVMNNLVDIIRGHGDGSAMVDAMQSHAGIGVGTRSGNFFNRGDSMMREAGLYDDVHAPLTNFSKATRDIVFKYMGLTKLSDIMELANGVANIQRMAEIAHGKKTVGKSMVDKYGFTPQDLEIIKKHTSFLDNGNVKTPTWEKMTTEEKTRFNTMLLQANNLGAQRSWLGSTAHYAYANPIGSAITKLASYPMNAFANSGLKQIQGVANGEIEASVGSFMMYVGGYVGMKLRDTAMGREREEEDYHKFALMNMSISAPYAILKSMMNPVVTTADDKVFKSGSEMFKAMDF